VQRVAFVLRSTEVHPEFVDLYMTHQVPDNSGACFTGIFLDVAVPLPTLFYGPEATNLGDLMRLWVRPGVWISLSPPLTYMLKFCGFAGLPSCPCRYCKVRCNHIQAPRMICQCGSSWLTHNNGLDTHAFSLLVVVLELHKSIMSGKDYISAWHILTTKQCRSHEDKYAEQQMQTLRQACCQE